MASGGVVTPPYKCLQGEFSGQTPGGGAGDGDVLIGADQLLAAGEADQTAAFGPGGELVTVGSDAHAPENVGNCIAEGFALLRECGFDRITACKDGKQFFIPITE